MQSWGVGWAPPQNLAGSPFKATLGITFFEGVAWVARGFESGTKSKYLWIVLETSSHPSHSCHTAIFGRLCSSLLASIQKGSGEGVAALSTEIIAAAAAGLMLCGAERCIIMASFCQPYSSEGRSTLLFLLSLHQS